VLGLVVLGVLVVVARWRRRRADQVEHRDGEVGRGRRRGNDGGADGLFIKNFLIQWESINYL
jgi:hypothetical protein